VEEQIKLKDNRRDLFSEIHTCYDNFSDDLIGSLTDIECKNKIDAIENIIITHGRDINSFNIQFANNIINDIDESNLIKAAKYDYKQKNISLRTNRRISITIHTLNGPLVFTRYVLRPTTEDDYDKLFDLEGKTSVIPMDQYLGISHLPTKLTVGAMLFTAKKAMELSSYKLAEKVLRSDHGIDICSATIMHVTNIIGNIAFNYEKNEADSIIEQTFKNKKYQFTNKKNGVLYIETDGAMFNTRKSNDNGSSWRENKLGLIFSSDNIKQHVNKKTGEIHNYILKKEYTSYIGEAEKFNPLLLGCALRNGYGQYKDTVLLSDGAQWIKTIKDLSFRDAYHILDFYHLKEKIYDFGKLYFNNYEKKYIPWSEKMCSLMLESKLKEASKEIEKMQKKVDLKEKTVNLASYISNNSDCINYKLYKSKGFSIGSGAIESANKTVLHKRLKQAGMRWNIQSAQNIVTLKAKQESNLWAEGVIIPVKKFYGIL
jgi:hypothetical protein